jgi:hypothetical protein
MASLNVEEIDDILHSLDGIQFIEASGLHPWSKWLTHQEFNERWQREIGPKTLNKGVWSGWYEALKWRTEQNEVFILFIHYYAPI